VTWDPEKNTTDVLEVTYHYFILAVYHVQGQTMN